MSIHLKEYPETVARSTEITIPTAITICGIGCIFLMFYYILLHFYYCALLLGVIAAITDYVDGKYARKHNQISALGTKLDPIRDKLLLIAAVLIDWRLGAIMGTFEVLAIIISTWLRAEFKDHVIAPGSKIITGAQMVLVNLLIAFMAYKHASPQDYLVQTFYWLLKWVILPFDGLIQPGVDALLSFIKVLSMYSNAALWILIALSGYRFYLYLKEAGKAYNTKFATKN